MSPALRAIRFEPRRELLRTLGTLEALAVSKASRAMGEASSTVIAPSPCTTAMRRPSQDAVRQPRRPSE
jgi:hypothetical protein